MPEPQTEGEKLFQDYLLAQGYAGHFEFETPCPGKSKVVDYTLTIAGKKYLFEVKDFAADDFPTGTVGSYDPYPPIREKINQGREKFREYKEQPCCLVLRNNGSFRISLDEPMIVQGAMYGDAGVTFKVNSATGAASSNAELTFLGRGKMLNQKSKEPQNTGISALITLRHVAIGQMKLRAYIKQHPELDKDPEKILALDFAALGIDLDEKHLGVIVWENRFAAIPFPRELFCGVYDERYGAVGDTQQRIFTGSGIPAVA